MRRPAQNEVAQRIVRDVYSRVELDREPLRTRLREALREPDDGEFIWERAERIGGEALREIWAEQLAEQFRLGLEHSHETAVVQAITCLDTGDDLAAHGSDSWLARAVVHGIAFEIACDVFDSNPEFGVQSYSCHDRVWLHHSGELM